MLRDPDQELVQRWIAEGGVITVVPFGVSGKTWSFIVTARRSGMWASLKRYGGLHIEGEAMAHIAMGEITAAQARVGVVWNLLARRGALSPYALGDALQLSNKTVLLTVRELVSLGAARIETSPSRRARHQVVPLGSCAPCWRDYLPATSRAA